MKENFSFRNYCAQSISIFHCRVLFSIIRVRLLSFFNLSKQDWFQTWELVQKSNLYRNFLNHNNSLSQNRPMWELLRKFDDIRIA
ncbi:hypothetical protein FWJ33_10855 [Leptospira interrogans serovar Hardjo]|nr:hypothetical protein FWJ33_10855 [Leptospira interrogans serovar Hardjo]